MVNQGERGFVELLERFLACGGDLQRLRREAVGGCLINAADGALVGADMGTIADLDEIPSPYLTGLLDDFLDQPLIPLLETNRSCPYRCTFCAWGIGTGKLSRFGMERLLDEIDYIGERCTKSVNMFIVDANFGILERDKEIAAKLYRSLQAHGFPGRVGVQWNKSRPDRILRVAREFRGLAGVGASMQSFDPQVLEAIKRKNQSLDDVITVRRALEEDGIEAPLFSELIVGLPNETWQSHIEGNRKLVDVGAEIYNYNLHLLPGTEMDAPTTREKYFRRTGWRLHDNAFGIYAGVKVFEGQEVVLETSTMSMEELRSFRFIHFLLQFMWGRRWYYDFLKFFQGFGVNPVDTILAVADAAIADTGEVGALYGRFKADHDLETFDTAAALYAFWSRPETFERLRSGDYGKLNFQYTYEILLGCPDAFEALLSRVAEAMIRDRAIDDAAAAVRQCDEIQRFTRDLRVGLVGPERLLDSKRRRFDHDVLGWRQGQYDPATLRPQGANGEGYDYEFFLDPGQKSDLEKSFRQFQAENVNLMLRKMSEVTKPDDFFYRVRRI